MNLSVNVKITKVKAHTAATTGTITGDEIDMSGYEGVVFLTNFGTANAGNYIKAQQDTVTGMATAADLEGTKVVALVGGGMIGIDLYKPLERFVRCIGIIGTSSTLETIWAIQYAGTKCPITNTTIELHVSPAEGTA